MTFEFKTWWKFSSSVTSTRSELKDESELMAKMPTCPLERYSHGGYLIKVVVMALAGEVTRELSPILSWSNNNYEI
jgi:hypothetical protein